jgi:predicted kinase
LIILFCGLPGVGKTTLANEVSRLVNAVVLSSDKIRKELIPKPTYRPKEKKLIYDIFILIAKYLNEAGVDCILDATFNKEIFRNRVRKSLALSTKEFCIVECACTEEIVISRLRKRKGGFSDADISIYRMMKKIFEPIPEPHIVANTSDPPKEVAKIVSKQILSWK